MAPPFLFLDAIQRRLDFDWAAARRHPQFRDPRGLGRVAVAGFALGALGGVHATLLVYTLVTPGLAARTWLVRWSLYVASLAVFHFMEFFATALYNPSTATYDSFVINHSKEYTAAALASWAEFWLELLLFPHSKTLGAWGGLGGPMLLLGALLLVTGQACRIVAMHTCREHFSHTVQTQRPEGHRLVTHGVYARLRHPSYFGWFWWVLGTQVVLGNPLCSLAYAAVSARFFAERIAYEEAALVRFYPEEYPPYRRRTWVGIPGVS